MNSYTLFFLFDELADWLGHVVLCGIVRRGILVISVDIIVAVILFLVVDHLLLLLRLRHKHVLLFFGDLQHVLYVSQLAGELVPLLLAG